MLIRVFVRSLDQIATLTSINADPRCFGTIDKKTIWINQLIFIG